MLHADVWRQRLDATTNWAVVSSAAIITFAFSQTTSPHFMLLVAGVFAGFFLVMESRRYQMLTLWRHRVRVLDRYLISPALAPQLAPTNDVLDEELEALAVELGSTRPPISMIDALGYRIRRNYGLLFAAIIATWGLKLWYHPTPTVSLDEFIARAAVGPLPGAQVFSIVIALGLFALFLALRARSEHMEEWTELPSPLRRLLRGGHEPREMSFAAEMGIRAEPKGFPWTRMQRDERLPRPADVVHDTAKTPPTDDD